jgi:hypothetical protein
MTNYSKLVLLIFILFVLLFPISGFACNATGTYVDRSGNIASLIVSSDGTINATSYSGTRWSSCIGHVIDDTTLWLAFHPTDNETATFVSNCSALVFPGSNPSVWGKVGSYQYPESTITDVHLVWMSHLDLGYTSYARTICDEYFDLLLPGNIALAKQLASTETPYVHTSHSFLIAEFLQGTAGCAHTRPSPSSILDMEDAIRNGYIRWHAQSANYNTPLLDKNSFSAQIKEADSLNIKYNVSYGTELMKSTDVPGFSRSMIPHLSSLGRRAVHTGANGKCSLARIPQAFIWSHPETNTSVIVLATNDYGGTLIIPPHVLIINYQGDNGGAPSAASVASNYESAKALYPNAKVYNSSFELFIQSAISSYPGTSTLPVITSEIGDSWLYGAPATPDKLAIFRESRRVISDALAGLLPGQTEPLLEDDINLLAFQRRIMIGGPEHNGGISIGGYLPSSRGKNGDWNNSQFHTNLATRLDYQFVQGSYDEKLNLTSQPLDPIIPTSSAWTSFLTAREERIRALIPTVPDITSNWAQLSNTSTILTCGRLSISFNATDGSISSLIDIATQHEWVSGPSFAGFVYRTYTEADFSIFNAEYNPGCGVPCENFSKDGMDSALPESKEWYPTVLGIYQMINNPTTSACSLLVHLSMPTETIVKYGGSRDMWISFEVDVDTSSLAPELGMTVMLFNKTITRLAEASFVSFTPNVFLNEKVSTMRNKKFNTNSPPSAWWLNVIGESVDPLDVVPFGTRHLHAVDSSFGFGADAPNGGTMSSRNRVYKASLDDLNSSDSVTAFTVTTLDASLVAPGDRDHLLFYDGNTLPNMTGGMHVNLHNNLWGTTFAQWWRSDAIMYRFNIKLEV